MTLTGQPGLLDVFLGGPTGQPAFPGCFNYGTATGHCSFQIGAGAAVYLLAQTSGPDLHSNHLASWGGDCAGAAVTGLGGYCSFTMSGDRDVTADFEAGAPTTDPYGTAPASTQAAPTTTATAPPASTQTAAPEPRLHVSERLPAGVPAVGDEYRVRAIVSSEDGQAVASAIIWVDIPAIYAVSRATVDNGSPCTVATDHVACDLGAIGPTDYRSLEVDGTVAAAGDFRLSVTSPNATLVNAYGVEFAPHVLPAPPTISGTPRLGATLRAHFTGIGSYQWQVCSPRCRPIPNATRSRLDLRAPQVGHRIRIAITIHDHTLYSRMVLVRKK